jgi:hypothetical protein
MTKTLAPLAAILEKDTFEKFATGLRIFAWLWIAGVTVVLATQLDVASVVTLELSTVVALELFGAAALVVGPGSIGLALSHVIERVSYLTADFNWF